MYVVFSLVGYGLLAGVSVLDKYIVSHSETKPALPPAVFVFFSTVFILPIFLLLFFGGSILNSYTDLLIAMASGFSYMFGLWGLYRSVAGGNVSQVGPLIGAVVPILLILFGVNYSLFPDQFWAMLFLIAGSLVISVEKRAGKIGFQGSAKFALVSALCFAVAHLTAKYFYVRYDFLTGLIWTKGTMSLGGLFLLALPSVRQFLFTSKSASGTQSPQRRYFAGLAFIDQSFGALGSFFLQYSMSLGSIAVVNALNGVQYVLVILLAALFTKFKPAILHEDYSRFKIIQEMVAVILIGAGLIILTFV